MDPINTLVKDRLFKDCFAGIGSDVKKIIIIGEALDDLRSQLSSWELITASFDEQPEELLKTHHLEDLNDVLILIVLPPNQSDHWKSWIAKVGIQGLLLLNTHPLSGNAAAEQLFDLAQYGLIPSTSLFNVYKDEANKVVLTQILFSKQDYVLRHPQPTDLDALVSLEEICWPGIGVKPEVIKERITTHPNDQIIVEKNNAVAGVIYSQRIRDADDLLTQTGDNVHQLCDSSGKIIQLIAVNIFPEIQGQRLGINLLEYALQWRSLFADVNEVVAVTRWGHYQYHHELSPEAYLHHTNNQGHIFDPIVHMHEAHGATIKGLIANYRPNDTVNHGYGVLVHYDLKTRTETQKARRMATIPIKNTQLQAHLIKEQVQNAILPLLPKESQSQFSFDAPLMGLGMESLELMELRDSLSALFNEPLHPTFLFLYGTAQKISDYFIEHTLFKYRDWLYNVEWVELLTPLVPSSRGSGVWVIYCDDTGFSDLLIAKLNSYGFTCVEVRVGAYFHQNKPNQFKIRPDSLEDHEQLFQTDVCSSAITGVIYLWGLFAELPKEPSYHLLHSLHSLSCSGLLNMVKALTQSMTHSLPRLFISSWTIGEEGSSMAISQWPMTGLAKAIAAEHPDFRLRQVSFDSKEGQHQSIDNLFLELFARDKEEQILWRGDKRLGPRLIRVELPETNPPEYNSSGTYVLVGGIERLGFAQWYAAKGARQLVLIDPNDITLEAQELIDQLAEQGVAIKVYANTDIGNESLMQQVFAEIKATLPAIKGVMFLAAMIDDDLLLHLTWERFQPIFNLTVAGSWNLHSLTKNEDLDHFILFSSIGSTMGPLWRANRSSANAFLDALAHYRNAQGLPSLTINWGPWGYEGIEGKNTVEYNIPDGFKALSTDEGIKVLDSLLNVPIPQMIAAPIDWSLFLRRFPIDKPLFTNMAREAGLRQSEIISRFTDARGEERSMIVRKYIEMILRRVLFMSPTAKISEHEDFKAMGLDDRALLEVKNQMNFDLGNEIELPFNIIVNNPSVYQLGLVLEPIFNQHLKQATTLETQANASCQQSNEPIAIIGMSCRFPGGANNPDQYWELLHNGTDAISEVPSSRWDIDAYYDADKDAPGKMYTRFGGFIDHVDLFDPLFFGISPREAEDMDPQQRISLEVTWEALEHAGIAAHTLKGSNTGVFIGICFNDYGQLIRQSGDVSAVDNYYSTGNHYSVAAGRISYILGLEGPAMAIDTACSSSLVSIDNAVKHLHLGQCNLAIAGGVNLILAPESTINFCKNGMLAEDGRCKTFDAKANGYVRSEGCGILILKRLSDAIRDNDRILSVIQATAINQDGAGTGLTVPNQLAQEHVIEDALKQANLKGCDIHYVEAHGTGTSLGDPIEVRALAATYGAQRDSDNPLLIGSAKTNIGHTEAAAGVAGLMKCVLALQHEEIPQHLHFHELNPYIELNAETIRVAQSAEPWRAADRPRYAAISSFGFSGTNSHAILSEAPPPIESDSEKPPYVLLLSGKTPEALQAQLLQYKAFLETHPKTNLSDLAYTLQLGREHFSYRQVVIGSTREELLAHFLAPGATGAQLPEDLNTAVANWLNGEEVAWEGFYAKQNRQKLSLPTYPFQRARYWAKTAIKSRERSTHAMASKHPILSEHQHLPKGLVHLSGTVDLSAQPLFEDHQVFDHIIFPGMGFIELMAVGAKAVDAQSFCLNQVSIEKPLLLTTQQTALVSVLLAAEGEGYQIQVDSEQNDAHPKAAQWLQHVTAKLSLNPEPQAPIDIKAWQTQCPNTLSTQATYASVRDAGLHYGAAFQGLNAIQVGEQKAIGTLDVSSQEACYELHPALMDSALQLLMVLLQAQQNEQAKTGVFLPIAFDAIKVYQTQFSKATAYLHLKELTAQHLAIADITLCDEQGAVLVALLGYQAKYVEALAFQRSLEAHYASDDLYYDIRWQDDSAEAQVLTKEQRLVGMYGFDAPLLQALEATFKAHDLATQLLSSIDELTHYPQCTDILFLGNGAGLEACHELLSLTHLLTNEFAQHPPQLWIITEGAHAIHNDVNPYQLPLIGLGRTLANEHPELHSRLIDLEPGVAGAAEDLVHALSNANSENQIAYRNHRRLVARLHADSLAEQKLPEHYHLSINPKGLLANLKIQRNEPRAPAPHEVQIQVHATGLNFRDVLNAMDLYPGNPGPLGLECAGVITALGADVHDLALGDAVMALSWDSFADLVTVHEALVTKKPAHLSFADAASIPLVFQTAYYSLITLGQLKKGDTLLIHAASRGIGDAAIQIAQHIGAEIYATASPGKWDFIKSKGVSHVYNSRTLDFADRLLEDTQGLGVDLVINALSGEFIAQTVRCIKPGGGFIEIGKRDIWSMEHMNTARPDINYHIVAIDGLMEHSPQTIGDLWRALAPLFETKKLAPLPITEFSISDAIAAFRYMQASKHIGKVVLTTQVSDTKKELCSAGASYLITAGLGGLGLELAKWLVSQGARHVVLTTRRDPNTEQQLQLDQLTAQGATLYLQKTDLRFKHEVADLFAFIKTNAPPLKGVFHTAGVVDDGIIQQQTWPRFEAVFAPKVDGSLALHEATKTMDLDYFVLFSSIVSVFGLAGQSNYAAANAFMDGLCAHRRSTGLPGLSINWGPWGEVGMAVRQHMNIPGMRSLSLKQGFHALHQALNSNLTQVLVVPMNWDTYLNAQVKESPLLSEMSQKTTQKTTQTQVIALKDRLTALPEQEREAALEDYLSKKVRHILSLKENQLLEPNCDFYDMGLDSLMAIELKNQLQAGLDIEIVTSDIFNYPTIELLTGFVEDKLGLSLTK